MEVTIRHLFNVVCKDGEWEGTIIVTVLRDEAQNIEGVFVFQVCSFFFFYKKAFILVWISKVKQDKGKKRSRNF